ncbi:porin family protein [Myxococcus sp. K15C18031901]|uniref:outer membrane beta-barrel protein n=1 Tax=Myxococcus dinghuensis TaxID=2906761 RepID=UPI0020A7F670|nr:outer membrane beta-barrel protein [Myxococcus dinghuensis]MCP3101071.1 porin family protein [Myxococcus dinghuensis]
MRRSMAGGVTVVALGLASPALAAVEAQHVAKKLGMRDDPEAGLDVRLGLGGLTGSLGDDTKVGPLLGIVAEVTPWKYLGFEAGYEIQRNGIDSSRVGDEGEGLWRNGLGVLAKVGPYVEERWRPFVGVGFGVNYFNPSDGADNVYRNDWTTDVPLAAGVEYRFGHLYAGARATYHLIGGENIVDRPGTDERAHGGVLNGNISVGGRF